MGLRCKVGDLVLLSARNLTNPFNVKFVGQIHRTAVVCVNHDEPYWRFDPPIYAANGRQIGWCDRDLDPIRDQPGEDETLAWAPVPGQLERV